MFANDLDIAAARAALATRGRVRIDGFLDAEVATRLRECLEHEVPWTLALRDGSGARTIAAPEYARLDAPAREALLREVASGAREDGFRFAYDSYMMAAAYREGRDPGLLLHRMLEVLNHDDVLALYRAITGDARIRRAIAQATRYRPGHFLRQHNDEHADEGRLYAYVINLSREWQPDWGGLLQFVERGEVVETFVPRWNSLSLFRVPAEHIVTPVQPWAGADRYAITGWWTL